MKRLFFIALFLSFIASASFSWAELDLDKELLSIPDTHNEKPYIWKVRRNPREFDLAIEETTHGKFKLGVMPSTNIENMHIFITDDDLHAYEHIRPVKKGDGSYAFEFEPKSKGKYRFEVVFKTEAGWVDIGKQMKLIAGSTISQEPKPGDEDYAIRVKTFPKRAYADHVTTFLFEISYKGQPLKGLDKIDGFDMQLASWDEDLKEFIYAVPVQNLGGPEVAVSLVFMRPGRHAVFAEFSHRGKIRNVEAAVDVLMEPRQGNSIENLRPAE